MALSRITNPFLSSSGAGNASITSPSANTIAFSTTTTERMRIDSSGNVGIGTSSPSYPLTVVTASTSVGLATYGRSSDNLAGTYWFSNTGATTYGSITVSASEFRITSTPAAAVQTFYTNGSERMRIDSSGNVGIGTSSPSSYGLLSVVSSTAGSAKISIQDTSGGASPAPLLQFGVNSSNGFNTSDAARIWTTSPSSTTASLNFAAYTGGAPSTAQMVLTGGNVGIGTSSPTTYKNAKLAIRNSASSGEAVLAVINNSSTVYEGAGILLGSTAASTNYGATWLYHTYNTNSPTNTTSYAFNISQRATDGTYVSNIWNVDYQNSVTTWYRPNTSVLQMQLDSNNNLLFNSGYGSAATAYGCRAWANFTSSATTPTLNASGNVTSVTRASTGTYTVNFTNAMPDANYSAVGTASTTTYARIIQTSALATGSFVVRLVAETAALVDGTFPICVAVFR